MAQPDPKDVNAAEADRRAKQGPRGGGGSADDVPTVQSAAGPTKVELSDHVTESEMRAARDAAAVTRQAGHADTLALWENSPEGKHFIEVEAPANTERVEAEYQASVRSGEKMARAQKVYEESVVKAQEAARADQDDQAQRQQALAAKAQEDAARRTAGA